MNSTPSRPGKLAAANLLSAAGMPVFSCRMMPSGDPLPPRGWERTVPSPDVSWRTGLALCGVCGVVFDVLDVDPRNGGLESFRAFMKEMGRPPDVHWKVSTPSGGFHMYVDCLGIGSHNKVMPGLDVKGGRDDGTGRGFVFLPPTRRPSRDPRVPGVHGYTYSSLPEGLS